MSASASAFMFPGQGSQRSGMLAAAFQQFRSVRDTFAEASTALGYDVWELVQGGDQDALDLTENTQPVLLTASVALWRAWLDAGGAEPGIMAGHSLGEFSALVCAGSLSFGDAVVLVRQRGIFMQTAVPMGAGAMAAIIGLDDQSINEICTRVSDSDRGVVAAVNFNSPGQVVVAGHKNAVALAIDGFKAAGAKRAIGLPVSAPFHTELMRPAGDELASELAGIEIAAPRIPVVHNVHARTESDPEKIRALLVEQIYSPVLWTRCMKAMTDTGVDTVVECGPGKVLTGLARRIDKDLRAFTLEDPQSMAEAQAALS